MTDDLLPEDAPTLVFLVRKNPERPRPLPSLSTIFSHAAGRNAPPHVVRGERRRERGLRAIYQDKKTG